MLKIAICDDEIYSVKHIHELIKNYFFEKKFEIEIKAFTDPRKLRAIDLRELDILFLDVEMGDKNGIDVAKEIRINNKNLKIIYISSYVDYAMSGYEVDAFNFLLKPQLDKTFTKCMDKLMTDFYVQQEELEFTMDYAKYKVPIKDIRYLESDVRKIKIYLGNDKEYKYTAYGILNTYDNQLSKKGFLRIQKSYLVNMNYIETISGYYVYLKNGEKLKTTIKTYSKVLDKWTMWVGAI